MKKIFTLLLFSVPFAIPAQIVINYKTGFSISGNAGNDSLPGINYYFSSAGNDSYTAAQAKSPATPWKTLTKLNSYMASMAAGEGIALKRGEVFSGAELVIGKNNIAFKAYGTGAMPVISGFTTVSSWVSAGSNIYESANQVSTLSSVNLVTVNGVNTEIGRTPNTGYWTVISTNGVNTVTDATHLNAAVTNWTGAELAIRTARWHLDRAAITAASGSTITVSWAGSNYDPGAGWGYRIQNDVRTLDLQNEWVYSSSTKKIKIYSVGTPGTVKVAATDVLVNLNGKSGISFTGIAFEGANFGIKGNGVSGQNSSVTVSGCSFTNIGQDALYLYPNSPNPVITNNTFTECNNIGINAGSSETATITGNTVYNAGNLTGMGQSGDYSYTGIISHGDNGLVQYNSVTNCGYIGIRWDGHGTQIKNNFVNTTNYIKDDGGGIYCYPYVLGPVAQNYTQRTVRDNIVLNAIGALAGGEPSSNHPEGYCIYADGTSPNIDFINNSMYNGYFGLFLNNSHDVNVTGNTIFDCSRGLFLIKYGAVPINDIAVNNNILVAKDAGQYPVYYEPGAGIMPATFTANNNCIARPVADNSTVWYDSSGNNVYATLAQWKARAFSRSQDGASVKAFVSAATVNDLLFVYNATSTAVTKTLPAIYADVKTGTSYTGLITLQPYTSAVLVKTGNLGALPVKLIDIAMSSTANKFSWKSTDETGLSYYQVQQSNDNGKTWVPVVNVPAAGVPKSYLVKL